MMKQELSFSDSYLALQIAQNTKFVGNFFAFDFISQNYSVVKDLISQIRAIPVYVPLPGATSVLVKRCWILFRLLLEKLRLSQHHHSLRVISNMNAFLTGEWGLLF